MCISVSLFCISVNFIHIQSFLTNFFFFGQRKKSFNTKGLGGVILLLTNDLLGVVVPPHFPKFQKFFEFFSSATARQKNSSSEEFFFKFFNFCFFSLAISALEKSCSSNVCLTSLRIGF